MDQQWGSNSNGVHNYNVIFHIWMKAYLYARFLFNTYTWIVKYIVVHSSKEQSCNGEAWTELEALIRPRTAQWRGFRGTPEMNNMEQTL